MDARLRRQMQRARVVIEAKLGRKLRANESVYFIDNNFYNLGMDNLSLVPTENEDDNFREKE